MIIAFLLFDLSTVLGFIDEAFDCDLILYRFVLVPSSVHSGILRHLCASASPTLPPCMFSCLGLGAPDARSPSAPEPHFATQYYISFTCTLQCELLKLLSAFP